MPDHTVIAVRDLGKRYQLGETASAATTLRDSLVHGTRQLLRRFDDDTATRGGVFWALKNVSFDVEEGEVLGVIGANGAGKSTLLKIMSQITEPTEGEVRVRGRVASLLEVGTGFHPELSGRENVFMNGAILGMTQAEIRRKFDEIVDFAGVEAFIDTPVKRYSSGMLVRLGFSVAAHLEPEILVVDEVLAVGDADFQQKCLRKMEGVSRSGRTILFVSHNMVAVQALCSRAVLIRQGIVLDDGPVEDVVREYYSDLLPSTCDVDLVDHSGRVRGSEPTLTRLQVLDDSRRPIKTARVGERITFGVTVTPRRPLSAVVVALHFYSWLGQRVMTLHSGYQSQTRLNFAGATIGEDAILECTCPELLLAPGKYRVVVAVAASGDQIDRIEPAASLEVTASDFYATGRMPPSRDGVFWPAAQWKCLS